MIDVREGAPGPVLSCASVKQERIALNSPIFSNAVVVFRLIRLAAKERSKWEHVVCQWETLAGIAKYAKRESDGRQFLQPYQRIWPTVNRVLQAQYHCTRLDRNPSAPTAG